MEKEIEISLYIASIGVARRFYRGNVAGLCGGALQHILRAPVHMESEGDCGW